MFHGLVASLLSSSLRAFAKNQKQKAVHFHRCAFPVETVCSPKASRFGGRTRAGTLVLAPVGSARSVQICGTTLHRLNCWDSPALFCSGQEKNTRSPVLTFTFLHMHFTSFPQPVAILNSFTEISFYGQISTPGNILFTPIAPKLCTPP